MSIRGIDFLQQHYYSNETAAAAVNKESFTGRRMEAHNEISESDKMGMRKALEVTDRRISDELGGNVSRKEEGAPYSYLADANGIIDYKGVIFTCDNMRRELCLGDMTNSAEVIRIPLSGGGCLKVNRNNIDQLSKAIGMFSPEDINLILRALKMDAKIQQMKKEIEELEDGIGKDNREQFADNTKKAEEAEQDGGKANGFNGYEEITQDDIYHLKKWQLDILTEENELL